MVVYYSFAQTWTRTSANTFGESAALSADGRIIMSVGSSTPVVSTNRGLTWTAIPDNGLWDIASSADGIKLIGLCVYNGYVNVSIDSGNTWTPTSSPNLNWQAIAISADGSKLFAGVNGGLIFVSTDFGTNWTPTGAPNTAWSCIALSADGTRLAAGTFNERIYTSTNSGNTWTTASSPSNTWRSIASSTDGSHLVATGDGGTYISTNSGDSWTQFNISGRSAASSADGSKLIVCNLYNYVYTSTNFGINWTTFSTPNQYYWFTVASSSDGNELVAGGNGSLWICQVTPSPQLNLTALNTNLDLAWLVPSANFVLQQNLDLTTTNWVTLTNTPALNLTNLNNELILSPSNSSAFYRLATL